MHRLRDSAAYRIAFTYSAAFALATILLGLIVYLAAHAAFVRQLDAQIAADAADLVNSYRTEGSAELREAIAAREAQGAGSELGYAVFDRAGHRVAGHLETRRPAAGWSNIVFYDPREGPDPARALGIDLPDGTRLVVAADREPLEAIDRTILTLFAAAFAVMLLMGTLGAMLLGGYLKRRIGGIATAADAIISGDLAQRMPVGPRNDEFDALSRTLNAMLDRIAMLLDNLRQVSSDVAHDLRTPLARLRNQLERARADPTAHREAIESAIARSDEVLALFAAILRISEIEGGDLKRGFATVDLSALAAELCESYTPAIEDGGRHLDCAIAPGVTVRGDRELIAQAAINLLDNAQIHTQPGSRIRFALSDRGALCVADDGPGVPEAERAHIVQRFTRLERSRSTPGHGLGLNLVAAIAAAHGAVLDIADNHPGLAVTLAFPETPR